MVMMQMTIIVNSHMKEFSRGELRARTLSLGIYV